MKVYQGSRFFKGPSRGVLVIGTFDGFHIGHQELIRSALKYAEAGSIPSILYSFDNHPLEVIDSKSGIHRLFPIEDLINNTTGLGVNHFIVEEFSKQFSQLSYDVFFRNYIYKIFKPSYIITGRDFRFGFNRKGSVSDLKNWQKDFNFQLKIIEPVKIKGQRVSSTWLRQTWRKNDFSLMKKLMGRPFCLEGKVTPGDGRGVQLGFPTANIETSCALPQKGVYVCRVELNNNFFKGVMNVGSAPTFLRGVLKVEVHIIEPFCMDLKGREVKVEILSRLRGEKKFNNVSDLILAVKNDIQQAGLFFKNAAGF